MTEPMKFSFVPGEEGLFVGAADRYTREQGYGFVTPKEMEVQPELKVPELNSGFVQEDKIRHVEVGQSGKGCFLWGEEGLLTFKLDVPQGGNYQVQVKFFRETATLGRWHLFSQNRRLSAWGSGTGEIDEVFMVNVCDLIPGGQSVRGRRRSIDLTWASKGIYLRSVHIRPADIPTLFLMGDSTVTDQQAMVPYRPAASYCGWGQMLTAMLPLGIAVSNHAHGGLTTESFREDGHYAILLEAVRPGDMVLIQFGHNDQKLCHLQANGGYRKNLIRYINELREKGGQPVLVTSLARNSWRGDTGEYNDLLLEYAGECRAMGEEMGVPVLDLHKRFMAYIMEKGLESSKELFYPGDYTHTNDYGGYLVARLVAGELKRMGLMKKMQWPHHIADFVLDERERSRKICGWLAPPESRCTSVPKGIGGLMSRLDALQCAKVCFAYFAKNTGEVSEGSTEEELLSARQNGYWPESFRNDREWLEGGVSCGEFIQVLELAAAGRSKADLSEWRRRVCRTGKKFIQWETGIQFLRELEQVSMGTVLSANASGSKIEVKGS